MEETKRAHRGVLSRPEIRVCVVLGWRPSSGGWSYHVCALSIIDPSVLLAKPVFVYIRSIVQHNGDESSISHRGGCRWKKVQQPMMSTEVGATSIDLSTNDAAILRHVEGPLGLHRSPSSRHHFS